MLLRIRNACLLCLASWMVSITASGQTGLCPPNLDFEMGDFTNWVCRTGQVSAPGGVNLITWDPTVGPVVNRHTIIAAPGGIDPYGRFPTMCPNGSGFCVKLGNNAGGAQAESVSYTYSIPSTLTVFSMIFHYAVVFQDPGHIPAQQPNFKARIVDVATNTPIACVNFDFTASANLPGFRTSPVDPQVKYKDWTPITINLNPYIGKTIKLEFITSDCTQGAHFAYAYMDVNTTCNGAITGTTLCEGASSVTLNAPFGFQTYQWFSDNTFTTVLSNTQSLTISPAPAPGTVYPVIVDPFPTFGCKDTLYGVISAAHPNPVSLAGSDQSVCKYFTAPLGAPPTPGLTYEWTPAAQVSNPAAANPIGWNIVPSTSTEFIVKTTDILTGCFSYDTAYINTLPVDRTINISGPDSYCTGSPGPTLSVSNAVNGVQWYETNAALPGATGYTYQPLATGSYWAQVQQNGCTDSTQAYAITVRPLPVAALTPDKDTGCVTNNSIFFKNNSTVADNSAMTYNWVFSDGPTYQSVDVTRSFSAVGDYTLELTATSPYGCTNKVSYGTIHILPNGVPDFDWDSVCLNRPVLFRNLSQENGSALVKYDWTFNDGNPDVLIKTPPPIVYGAGGKKDVTLRLTTLGCENDPQTIVKNIQVNVPAGGIRYRTITVPQGSSHFIRVRDTIGHVYEWTPAIQLSNYNKSYTEFYATADDVEYLINITDGHTCITTDTILMQVLKKPGFYLPTAFTPNGDGLNDVIRPYLVGMKGLKSFTVFSRWGNVVFFSKTYGEAWDGKFRGEPQASGTYVWVLEFYTNDGKTVTEKGTLTLIR